MNETNRILLIEDDLALAEGLLAVLGAEGYPATLARRGDEGLRLAQSGEFAAVLTDLRLPGLDGLELARRLRVSAPRLPIVLMTAHGSTETAIEAMKEGAYDYLQKPFEMPELIALLAQAVEAGRLMREAVAIGEAPTGRVALVGQGKAIQSVFKEIGRVAAKPVTVLIRGETGTGKELVARAIYQHSDRANAAFVAINCAAIPENLLESELFGHERGAFTGAEARRIGRFEQAHGGTLFLDEIGDLSANTQVKLLRVLQEKCIQRVGGRETIQVDVRVIAATHRDLEAMMLAKQFREDLFYRLSVVVIKLPPLRERREDIPVLVKHFLARFAAELDVVQPAITPDAVDFLQMQPWPGNIRELENTTRRLLLASRGLAINSELARHAFAAAAAAINPQVRSLAQLASELLVEARQGKIEDAHARLLAEAEREIITQAIEQADGNQARAARWLGISRITLREKLRQFGLHPTDSREPGAAG